MFGLTNIFNQLERISKLCESEVEYIATMKLLSNVRRISRGFEEE
jgi:hypothetical protein